MPWCGFEDADLIADGVSGIAWYPLARVPKLAFDHNEILSYGYQRLRNKLEYSPIAFDVLPEVFTLGDLYQLYATVLGENFADYSNFRARLLKLGFFTGYRPQNLPWGRTPPPASIGSMPKPLNPAKINPWCLFSAMKLAFAQLNPTIGDLTHNAQQILEAAQQASNQDAALLITTELVLCGYPPRDLLLRPSFIKAMADTLDQLVEDIPKRPGGVSGVCLGQSQCPRTGRKSPIQQHCPAAGREGAAGFPQNPAADLRRIR